MEELAKRKIRDISNEDLFRIFDEYLEKTISHDLSHIHGQEAKRLDSDETLIFELKK